MEKEVAIRSIRIAVSAFSGVLTVLLVVLWVRSYWWMDHFQGPGLRSGTVNFWSGEGRLTFQVNPRHSLHWNVKVRPYPDGWKRRQSLWGWDSNALGAVMAFPYWLPTLVFAILTASPWARVRFTLRTMLIATTLVAAIFGLGVWMGR